MCSLRSKKIQYLFVCGAGVLASLCAVSSQAQVPTQPLRYVDRPLTLPTAVVRPDVYLSVMSVEMAAEREEFIGLLGGVAAGFTADLELGAFLVPLALAPDADYADPWVYGMYRLVSNNLLEVGLYSGFSLPVQSDFRIHGGLPLLFRAMDSLRINTGGYLGVLFSDPAIASLEFPLQVAVQASPSFFIGPELGVCLGSSARPMASPQMADTCLYSLPREFDNLAVPLGVFGGYSVANDRGVPWVDLRYGFRFIDVDQGFDAFVLHAGANFYIYL